jgi:hypothetical protein
MQGLAQTVRGHVLESGTETPVVLAEVTLLDTVLNVVDQTYSAHDGAFVLQAPDPGSFYVRATALGYRPKLDGVAELSEGGVLPVVFFLVPDPLEVEGVEATAERKRVEQFLESQDFYQRQQDGRGYFITPEEIEKRNVRDFVRLFQNRPVEVEGGVTGTELWIRRGFCKLRGRKLYPTIWVNGVLVDPGWRRPGGALERVVAMADVLAVEIYTGPASTPAQWSGTNLMSNQCGTIVFWTKGG